MDKRNLSNSAKNILRTEVKRRVSLLSEEEKKNAAESLCKKLLDSPRIQEAHNIIVYDSLADEIGLDPFIKGVKKEGKNIFTVHLQGTFSCLPAEAIIIVPGRAFTLGGKRIGRGGGWYDRFLSQYPQLYSIGVCFECQIFDDIPQDSWDIPLNTVVYSSVQSGQ